MILKSVTSCFISCHQERSMTCVTQIKGDPIRTDVKTLYIDDLCVDENCRGKHVGSILYKAVREYACENGFHNITLHVWEGNDNAAAFYKKMGLTPQFTCLEEVLPKQSLI